MQCHAHAVSFQHVLTVAHHACAEGVTPAQKVDMLQRCKELQEPCGSAVSALRNALAQMQAMQAQVPLNGKKRKRSSDDAK